MRYWWVNHSQTFDHEVGKGYIWCPKRKRNGAQNHFYEIGDVNRSDASKPLLLLDMLKPGFAADGAIGLYDNRTAFLQLTAGGNSVKTFPSSGVTR